MTIVELVERERVSLRRGYLAAGVGAGVAFTCALLAAGTVILGNARWMALPRGLPILLWLLVVAGDVAGILLLVRWLRSRATRGEVAERIEQEQSLRCGALRGVLEVGESGPLGRHAADAMSARLAGAGQLVPRARRTTSRRAWQAGAAAAVAIALLGAAAPSSGDGLLAILRPDRAWRGTLLSPLQFEGLPPVVMRGEQLRLRVLAPGRRSVTLFRREEGEGWRSERLAAPGGDSGRATTLIGPLRGDIHLVVSDGRSSTDTVLVRVTDRPFVGDIAMRATYPAYLGRPAEELPMGEPAHVPYGTMIDLSGHASAVLQRVGLVDGHDSLQFAVSSHGFTGRIEAKRSGSWQWVARATSGTPVDVPSAIELEVIPDSVPTVVITSPSVDTMVASTDRISLLITASDDHGLTSVQMRSWRTPAGDDSRAIPAAAGVVQQHVATPSGAVWSGSALVELAPRGLQPGDVLHVSVVAIDNSPWAQRGESRDLLLRIPTADERRELARTLGDSAVAAAQSAVKAERAIQDRTAEMARDRGARDPSADATQTSVTISTSSASAISNPGSMSFQSAERARALARDQRTLTDQVKQLEAGAKSLEDQLRQAGALDSSLARELQEAQALLKDALTPELLAQMQKLDNAAQQLSQSDAQTTLKDLQAMQAKLREQLEKSAELLKRAALEGSMQTLADEANDLAARDRQLADSLHGSTRPDTKRPDARQLADQTEHLRSAMQTLQDRLGQDQAEAGVAHTAEAQQHALDSREELRAAGSTTQGSSMENDSRSAAAQMRQSALAMQAARDAQIQSWKAELTSTLDQSIQEILQMSREETALEQQVRGGQADDVRGAQSAIKQGLDDAAKHLQQEGQKSSLLSNRSQTSVSEAEHSVQQAVQSSSASTPRSAETASSMEDAAAALNRAAASLARDRARANTATSATGFAEMMQELQAMANKQGAINAQSQNLLSMPGSQMTAAMQATARELARQQRQLAQQLEELGDGPGGDRASQMALQAKQVADALDNGQLNAETLGRQQQLFHKMLDAGRTLEQDEREDGDHREAKSATQDNPFAPTTTNGTGKAASRFREPTWDELRGLSADERRAILDYFQKINGHGG